MKPPTILTFGNQDSHCKNFLYIGIFVLLQYSVVSCLRCYECTSENPGCDKISSSSSLITECSPSAIGCAIYAYYFEYFIGTIFHRSCVYSYDLYNDTNMTGWLVLDSDGYDIEPPGPSYKDDMDNWNEARKEVDKSAPDVVQAKYFPIWVKGTYKLRAFLESKYGDLSNGLEFSKWTWPGFKQVHSPNKTAAIDCYSCEFEIKDRFDRIPLESIYYGTEISFDSTKLEKWNFPPCSSGDASPLKKISCKNAYGCAALLEIRNASAAVNYNNGTYKTNDTVARVWRGCWYPGDQKCLRNPKFNMARNNKSPKGRNPSKIRNSDTQSDQCEKAYKRSFETKTGVVVWAGIKKIKSSSVYNDYLQCRHDIRTKLNVESTLNLVSERVKEDFTWIQYQFCGPKSKCNKFINVDGDTVGKAKYNPKDYDDAEKIGQTKNQTKLDDCLTSEEDSKDSMDNGSPDMKRIAAFSKIFVLLTAAYLYFCIKLSL